MGAGLSTFLGLKATDEVARAQVAGLKQRIPYLYAIVSINVIALSWTHLASNAFWKVVLVPALLVGGITIRMLQWFRFKPEALPIARIRQLRRSTIWLGGLIGLVTTMWALSLTHDVEPWTSMANLHGAGHVTFFVGITVVSCIFLLMHLRMASIMLAFCVVGPFVVHLLLSGRAIEHAIALNLLLVTGAMLYVAASFARDFERMVTTAADLSGLASQNARLAASDALSGLPNRRRFFSELEDAGRGDAPFAVVLLDLDGFKQINDVYGHNAGDELLRSVSGMLQGLVPAQACLARTGGDEFACLLVGEQVDMADAIAEALIAACATPIECARFTAHIGASAGICRSKPGERDGVSVYEHADYALFEAKREGRGRVQTFTTAHESSMRRVSNIAHSLRSADFDRELSLMYQPIFAAGDHALRSFEALVRWRSPELGAVGPAEFIPIAERTDLIFEISRHIVRTALRDVAAWPDHVRLKINLSVRDLMSPAQTETLLAELKLSSVNPTRITFEMTETALAESLAQVRDNVDLLRAAGCAVAIDDFGVGYSSLNYIHVLSPDVIKIDRCFIAAAETDPEMHKIIRTIIELTHSLGAKSVAEGVETPYQARLLADLGCDELQGYYLSKPLQPDMAKALACRPCQSTAPNRPAQHRVGRHETSASLAALLRPPTAIGPHNARRATHPNQIPAVVRPA